MKAETIMSRMRIFRSILAVIIAVLVLRPVPTYSSQDATMITALAVDPLTPTTLYAGTQGGGVFNSTDGGTSWAMSAWLNDYESAQTLAIAPHTDLQTAVTLFTGTTLGVLKSTDGGVSWNATGLTGVGVLSLVIDPL